MLELTAAQTLIALPEVGRITGIGLALAVFTYDLALRVSRRRPSRQTLH